MNQQKQNDLWLKILAPAMLTMIGLLVTARFWGDFQLFGHSAELDYMRQLSFDRCIRAGIFFPRWLPDTYFGYGSPLFNFYGPLPYYLTEFFILAGVSVASSFKAVMILALIVSGLGMYLLCRDFAGHQVSFIAGLAFMLAPYHMVDMVVRHAFGEHISFAFLPLAAWGLSGMVRGNRPLRLLVGALCFSALILTHNITAMLAMGVLGFWWLLLALRVRKAKLILWGAALICFALLIAAFFWVPVMIEKDLTWADQSLTSGYFVYWDHFVHPAQLIKPTWGFGGSRKGVQDDNMSFQIGVPHLLFVLAGFGFFIAGFKRDSHLSWLIIFGLVVFVGGTFFTLSISTFAYKLWPYFSYVQFPWRFLVFVAFGSSILAASLEPLAKMTKSEFALPLIMAFAGGLIIIFYAGYAKPSAHMYWQKSDKFHRINYERIPVFDQLDGYNHIWEIDAMNRWLEKGETGTSRDDYLPKTVDKQYKPMFQPHKVVRWAGEGTAQVEWLPDGPVDLVARVQSNQDGALEFARFYFPGWVASVNGRLVEIGPRSKFGTILVPVKSGRNEVELKFKSTPFRAGMGFISLSALCGLVLFVILSCWHNHRKTVKGTV